MENTFNQIENEIETNTTKNYINFTKLYLEKTILDKLKIVVNDNDLSFNSEIINDFGKPINVGQEITEYIEVMGEDLIKDFHSIDNKIDEWFFEYKANENYYNSSIDNDKTISKKEELENIQKELNTIENKILDKIENTNIIDEHSQYTFKNIVKSIFDDFRSKINTFLSKFKNNTIDNNTNNNSLIDNEMKVELLKIDTLSPKILDKLSKDNDISTLRKIVNHPNTSSETLEYIFNNTNDFKVMENLLNNNKTPQNIIDNLVINNDKDIFLKALTHENISSKHLNSFSKTEDIEIIEAILQNKNCDESTLQNIVAYNINNDEIIKNVINHNNCSENLHNFIDGFKNKQDKKTTLKDKIKEKQKIINKSKDNKKDLNQKQTKAKSM